MRIGVCGAGAWGRNLLRNIDACQTTTLAAICDADCAALASAGERYPDAQRFEAFGCMIAAGNLDAVVIASPPRLHFEHAKRALEAGLHVLVEKPITRTSIEASELIALATAHKRILMTGHTFLYSNLVHDVKKRIDSGELGDVLYIHSQRLNLGRVRSDVDALWNFAPHDISITTFLMDAWPVRVSARGACFVQKKANVSDLAFFQMDFADGRVMGGHVSWLDPQKVRRMVVVGSEKMLVYDDVDVERHIQVYDKSVQVEFQSSPEDFSAFRANVRAGDVTIPNIRLVEPLGVEIAHFAECISTGQVPRSDGVNGMRVVCTLEALSRSMELGGETVDVDYSGATTASVEAIAAKPQTVATAIL